MKRLIHTLFLAAAVALMAAPDAQAQRHGGANGGRERRESPRGNASTSSHGNRTQNNSHGTRPGLSGSSNTGSSSGTNVNRPSNAGNHNRPAVGGSQNNGSNHRHEGINGNSGHRPAVGGVPNRPASNRPAVGGAPSRPTPNRPAIGANHYRPGQGPRPVVMQPPHRPYRPVMMRPHYRPVPPPAWRPANRVPVIRGILGLSFGITIGSSLDYLFNSGYTVDGYGNDIVYLRNVPALNYIWTDGALYYGPGGLDASSFYYSTPIYDMSRYNNVYRGLVTSYGAPVTASQQGGIITSTWFGGNDGYITLSFGANNGRYLTTLTMGM